MSLFCVVGGSRYTVDVELLRQLQKNSWSAENVVPKSKSTAIRTLFSVSFWSSLRLIEARRSRQADSVHLLSPQEFRPRSHPSYPAHSTGFFQVYQQHQTRQSPLPLHPTIQRVRNVQALVTAAERLRKSRHPAPTLGNCKQATLQETPPEPDRQHSRQERPQIDEWKQRSQNQTAPEAQANPETSPVPAMDSLQAPSNAPDIPPRSPLRTRTTMISIGFNGAYTFTAPLLSSDIRSTVVSHVDHARALQSALEASQSPPPWQRAMTSVASRFSRRRDTTNENARPSSVDGRAGNITGPQATARPGDRESEGSSLSSRDIPALQPIQQASSRGIARIARLPRRVRARMTGQEGGHWLFARGASAQRPVVVPQGSESAANESSQDAESQPESRPSSSDSGVGIDILEEASRAEAPQAAAPTANPEASAAWEDDSDPAWLQRVRDEIASAIAAHNNFEDGWVRSILTLPPLDDDALDNDWRAMTTYASGEELAFQPVTANQRDPQVSLALMQRFRRHQRMMNEAVLTPRLRPLQRPAPRVEPNEVRTERRRVQLENGDCPICFVAFEDPHETPCGHIFCYECVEKWAVEHRNCPTCRRYMTRNQLIDIGHMVEMTAPIDAADEPSMETQDFLSVPTSQHQ